MIIILMFPEFGIDSAIVNSIQRVCFIACGTSYHAAMIGRYWMEEIAHMPSVVELASEVRTRPSVFTPTNRSDLVVGVSQSGETLDTLAALFVVKPRLCSCHRECDG